MSGQPVDSIQRDSNGKLPGLTRLGAYTIIYLTKDDGVLCSDCASSPDTDPPAVLAGTYDEGPPLECEGCGRQIESSSGDPDDQGCQGHESLNGGDMGVTVHCDGSCR
jgi:hypothetical protein